MEAQRPEKYNLKETLGFPGAVCLGSGGNGPTLKSWFVEGIIKMIWPFPCNVRSVFRRVMKYIDGVPISGNLATFYLGGQGSCNTTMLAPDTPRAVLYCIHAVHKLWSSRYFGTTTPISPIKHCQWYGMRRIEVPQHQNQRLPPTPHYCTPIGLSGSHS